jgi:hypothetical protein
MTMPPLDAADLLLRAATALRSTDLLAERLGVTTDQLGAWMRREEKTPDMILIKAAKIVGERY